MPEYRRVPRSGYVCCILFGGTDCVWLAGSELIFRLAKMDLSMATDGAAVVDGRAGITFGVELYVPWDAPEAVVDLQSEGGWSAAGCCGVPGSKGKRCA